MSSSPNHTPTALSGSNDLALVLTGGGARGAYQVGILRTLARHFPESRIPIITGVSAGAINAAFLAAHPGSPVRAVADLSHLWEGLTVDRVFQTDTWSLARNVLAWILRLGGGGIGWGEQIHSLVSPKPLRRLLMRQLRTRGEEPIDGIQANLERGNLHAVAITGLNYGTGQTITWVEGKEISNWERPHRRSRSTRITVDHIMASAALPLLFPAVKVKGSWYGDGGVRLTAPLSPALHLGATNILAISTRYDRSAEEAERSAVRGYPPPAQILGQLLNSVFLDNLEADLQRAQRINKLLANLEHEEWNGLKPVRVVVLRPSQDLGRLAAHYEADLPGPFRFLTRGLGTKQTESPDLLSLLLFAPAYLERLIQVGEQDAEARLDEIGDLLSAKTPSATPH